MNDHTMPTDTLGADLRALRKARGFTLGDLAGSMGKSVGWLSQVERDLSTPTIDDLRDLASHLQVPVSMFFGQPKQGDGESGFIVRAHNRREIGAADGLSESLLSPDLTDSFEVLHCTFAPGARKTVPVSRETQEVGTIIKGRLSLWIDETRFELREGDSFRVRGETYRWENPHDVPALAIWVISPPVY